MSDITGGDYRVGGGERSSHAISTGFRPSGDAKSPTLKTYGSSSTGAASYGSTPAGKSPTLGHRTNPVALRECRRLLDASINDIDKAIDLSEEFFLRCNALSEAKDRIQRLWSIRKQREPAFAAIVNGLQILLAGQSLEEFTTGQLEAMRVVLESLREEESLDDQDVKKLHMHLIRNGCNVFRGLQ